MPTQEGTAVSGIGVDGTAADQASNVPSGTLHAGDFGRFITDVTIPDGTTVKTNEQFLKVWEIENAGKVVWHGRFMERLDLPVQSDDCTTPDRSRSATHCPTGEAREGVDVL